MFTQHKADAPQRTRPGLTSHALLQRGDVEDTELAVTWVDVAPGDAQEPHCHPPEQVYVSTSSHAGKDASTWTTRRKT